MNLFRRVGTAFAVIIAAVVAIDPVGAQISPAVVERTRSSTFRMEGQQCAVEGRLTASNGTGFAAFGRRSLVTALHVVAGCRSIQVFNERQKKYFPAVIDRILVESDLALLSVEEDLGVGPLPLAESDPGAGARLSAVGYGEFKSLGDLDVAVQSGYNTLNAILDDKVLNPLSAATGISEGASIVRFKSSLQPGYSGAPITNADGEVVAVGAGGLMNGQTEASWGWPVSMVKKLPVSPKPSAPTAGVRNRLFFSRALGPAESRRTVDCGGLTFEFSRRLSYQAVRLALPQSDIDRVSRLSLLMPGIIDRFEFDTWIHRESGATLVTPADANATSGGQACIFESLDKQFRLVAGGARAATPAEIQRARREFEASVWQNRAPACYDDAVLNSAVPTRLRDGLIYERRGFYCVNNMTQRIDHYFASLIPHNATFFGVASQNRQYKNYVPCIYSPNIQGCDAVVDELAEFSRFIFSVELSTYTLL